MLKATKIDFDWLNVRQNLGLSLVFVGVTISMYLNFLFPVIYWTPVIMLASCVLLLEKRTFSGVTKWNKIFKYLYWYQLMMLAYLIIRMAYSPDFQWAKQLSFHFYVLTLIFIFMRTPSLQHRDFLPYLLVISSVLSVICLICHQLNLYELTVHLVQTGMNDKIVLEIFTSSIAVYINYVVCLLLIGRKKIKLFTLILFCLIVLDVYCIVLSGKRSYFVALAAVAIFYLHKSRRLVRGACFAVVIFAILLVFVPSVMDSFATIIDRTISGFSDVYGGGKSAVVDWDDSASVRVYLQERAFARFSEFTFLNLLFGAGYLACFFDNPLVEAYLDMGLLGIWGYFFLIIYVPLSCYRKIRPSHKRIFFCFLYALMNICVCITNNDPYTYLAYTPLCLMALYSYKN